MSYSYTCGEDNNGADRATPAQAATSTPSVRATLAIYGLAPGPGGKGEYEEYEMERALRQVHGVRLAYVSAATEMAYIEYNPAETTKAQLLAAIQNYGLSAGELNVRSIGQPMTLNKESQARASKVTHPVPAILADPPRVNDNLSNPQQVLRANSVNADNTGVGTEGEGGVRPGTINSASDHNRRSGGTESGFIWRRSSMLRPVAYAAFRVIVLGVVLGLIAVAVGQSTQRNVYTVEAAGSGFTPVAVVIPAGEQATLRVRNADSAPGRSGPLHEFAISELGIDVTLGPGETTEINIPPLQPGTFHYYCDVCCGGSNDPAMQGALIVH